MLAERVGRLADRPVDIDASGRRARSRQPGGVGRRARRATSARRWRGVRRRAPAGSARSCRRRGRPGGDPGRGHGARARPASRRGRPGTAPARSPSAEAGDRPAARREAAKPRGRSVPAPAPGSPSDATGNPPPTSSVSNAIEPAPDSATSASARRTPSRQASIAPSCDPTWRWMPRGRGPRRRREAVDRLGQLRLGQAELRPPRPTARPIVRLGGDVRVEPAEDVERSAQAPARDNPAGHRELVGRLDGEPEQRVAVAAASTAARRSASVLPTPSSVMRPFGTPAARGRRPLAARDDIRSNGRRRPPPRPARPRTPPRSPRRHRSP